MFSSVTHEHVSPVVRPSVFPTSPYDSWFCRSGSIATIGTASSALQTPNQNTVCGGCLSHVYSRPALPSHAGPTVVPTSPCNRESYRSESVPNRSHYAAQPPAVGFQPEFVPSSVIHRIHIKVRIAPLLLGVSDNTMVLSLGAGGAPI